MAPSRATKFIATTWGKPSSSTVASAALGASRKKADCSSGVSRMSGRGLMTISVSSLNRVSAESIHLRRGDPVSSVASAGKRP